MAPDFALRENRGDFRVTQPGRNIQISGCPLQPKYVFTLMEVASSVCGPAAWSSHMTATTDWIFGISIARRLRPRRPIWRPNLHTGCTSRRRMAAGTAAIGDGLQYWRPFRGFNRWRVCCAGLPSAGWAQKSTTSWHGTGTGFRNGCSRYVVPRGCATRSALYPPMLANFKSHP